MLADFYISMLSNDMKKDAQKNHLGGQICTEVWTLLKNYVTASYLTWDFYSNS